jgi:hypothetical protein
MATRTGIVALVQLAKHACRILTTFRPAIDSLIAAAVTAGSITTAQQTTLESWLNLTQAACDVLKVVTGY